MEVLLSGRKGRINVAWETVLTEGGSNKHINIFIKENLAAHHVLLSQWGILFLLCPFTDKQLTFGMTHSIGTAGEHFTVLFWAVNLISEGISHFIFWAIKPISEEQGQAEWLTTVYYGNHLSYGTPHKWAVCTDMLRPDCTFQMKAEVLVIFH